MTRATRIYIAGPMTGIEGHNFPAFNRAAEELRAAGWDVVNPADHGVIDGFEWADYLRYDLTKLAGCTDIYLLPGWERSKGATLEHHIATTLGMNRHYAAGAAPALVAGPKDLDAARYRDVCRVLNELLPGWDSWDDSAGNESELACRAIRELAKRESLFGYNTPEGRMLCAIGAELKRARGLFPGDRITTLAMAEEFGELVKAVLDEPAANVRKEAVQTAVMAIRVVLDGDGSVNEWWAAKGLDALGVGDAH